MDLNKIAIVQLCYADFESLEISLAATTKFMPENMKLFLLQNGRGSYDCERTYQVAKRYADLFPKNIVVVDWIEPQRPYTAIKTLLNSKEMAEYEYIIKIDDDVFPITKTWVQDLVQTYKTAFKKYGENLGYVTSLVNNNPWGFIETLEVMNLKKEYFEKIARDHIVDKNTLVSKDEIRSGVCGTIWRNPFVSRWLHENTTLHPDLLIQNTKDKEDKAVNHKERYSINCMLFKKDFWNKIALTQKDDEHDCFQYCLKNDKKIIASIKTPMIHLFFFIQRNENKDLIPIIRSYYEKWLALPFPISLCPIKEYENENRLRFLENKLFSQNKKRGIFKRIFKKK